VALSLSYENTLSRVRITADGLSVTDTFTRTVSNGWGASDSGHVWSTSGGSPSDYSVDGSSGLISLGSVSTSRTAATGSDISDVDVTTRIRVTVLATGGYIAAGPIAYRNAADLYYLRCEFNVDQTIALNLFRIVGSSTGLASATATVTHSTGTTYTARLRVAGQRIQCKFWQTSQGEPGSWDIDVIDPSPLTTPGAVGVRAQLSSANTNALPVVVQFDNFTAVPAVTVERSTDQVRWTTVRGGAALTPVNGAISLDDYEFTPDVRNFYRVLDQPGYGPPQNPNTSFETDTSGWQPINATITRSTAQAHDGTASLLITPDGTSGSGGANAAGLVPVTPGETIRVSLWAYSPSGWSDLRPCADWHDAGGAFLSSGLGSGFAVPAATWTYLEQTLTVPAGAAFAKMRARHGGTPSASDIWYADQVELRTLGITPVLDGVWLKSISNPALNRKVTVRDWSDITRPSRTGLFQVVGAKYPIAVTEVRGSRQWTLELRADLAEAAAIDALLDDGGVLLVHVPADSTVPGGYVVAGDSSEKHFEFDVPKTRFISLPLTEVAAPPPEVTGVAVP